MDISIIIVNYNGKKYLGDCVQSIGKFTKLKYEIIILDNASTDKSAEYIVKSFPSVHLIASDRNHGFARGNNIAALNAKGKYLLLLNNDTRILSSIDDAVDLMNHNENIGVVGAKMLGVENEYRYSAGFFPSPIRLLSFSSLYTRSGSFMHGNFSNSSHQYYPVDWVEGSFLLTRRDLWQKLSGLDEGYFMYTEDIDYCKRVHNAGYLTVYLPSATYVHFGGYGQDRLVLLIKGFRRYSRKFFSYPKMLAANSVLSFGLIGRLIYFCILSLFGISEARNKMGGCWRALSGSPW